MISDILQQEKNKIAELLEKISYIINNLKFMNMANYPVSDEFKKRWDLRITHLFSYIDNYISNEFPIVVLGRWNSGKSTLINAILGEDILPTANKEMTSILTKIYHGDEDRTIVHLTGGLHQNINCSELEDYISYRGKKYSKEIEQVDIISNNIFLKGGLCIIDSPGLCSINELNNNISFNILPKASSILLTFSGLDVGGDDNLNLIEQVCRLNYDNLHNVVFVITKIDLLSEREALEAEESLKELIQIVQNRLGKPLENKVQICMLSSYMELKYQQYLKHLVSAKSLLNDSKLNLLDENEIHFLHNKSKFDEFYRILDKSILNSENKTDNTYNLFNVIENVLTELLDDYKKIYSYLLQSNKKSLKDISRKLQQRVDIERQIFKYGKVKIKLFCDKITILTYQYCTYDKDEFYIDSLINNIFAEICKYIDNTPYEVISKNKFSNLNKEINTISTKLTIKWMKAVSEKFNDYLTKTISEIAEIIKENDKKINKIFDIKNTNDKEKILNVYQVKMKTNIALSNFMTSFIFSASTGASFLAIGNIILPGIGGIIGSIIGGLAGLFVSIVNTSNSKQRKENLIHNLNKYLFSKKYKYIFALHELKDQYIEAGNILDHYLNDSLNRVLQEKDSITKNYENTKVKYKEIEENLLLDIESIENLLSVIKSAFFESGYLFWL